MKKIKISERSILNNPAVKKNLKMAKLFVISMFFVFFALVFALVMVSYISNRSFRETFYSVSSLKVDSKIRVIHLSDLHNCNYGKENEKLLNRIKKLKPDLIICTGDMIDSGKDKMESTIKLCTELNKISPSYYVYGNNEVEKIYGFVLSEKELDKKFGFNSENRNPEKLSELKDEFEKKLEKGGIKVLKNETDIISVGTTNIEIFGSLTSNPSSFWSYSCGVFENYIGSNHDNLKITAIHEPFIFEDFSSDTWGDLLLCGHTHGGTVRVPVLGPLYTHEGGFFPERSEKYVYGRYNVSGAPLIVSSGLENSNVLRINNQPELVVVDINKF